MKHALVTGGAGFLGSHLCERLLASGCAVTAVDNLYTGSRDNMASFAGADGFEFIEADVAEASPDDFASARYDAVFNLACPASPVHYQARPLFTTMTSIKGVALCLGIAERDGATLLHCSTSEVYGDPLEHPQKEAHWGNVNTIGERSCYDEGKRVAETIVSDSVRTRGVDARMVRIFNTYGPRMHPQDGRVVSNFIVQALAGDDITIYGDGSQTRSFQYCDDLIDAFMAYMALGRDEVRSFFAAHGLGAPVLNVGNPGEYTIRQLAEMTLEMIPGTGSRLVTRPLPGDDPRRRRPDISLARELLGWSPKVPLSEGLAKTIAYFKGRAVLKP